MIDAIIERAGPSVTSFVPIVKAYNDVFMDRGLDAAEDVAFYQLLLKLGIIKAANWGERWNYVKDQLSFGSGKKSRLESRQGTSSMMSLSPQLITRPSRVDDEDTFTLHSRVTESTSALPPRSKPVRQPALPKEEVYDKTPRVTRTIPSIPPFKRAYSPSRRDSSQKSTLLVPPRLVQSAVLPPRPSPVIIDESTSHSVVLTTTRPPSYRTLAHERDLPLFKKKLQDERESIPRRRRDILSSPPRSLLKPPSLAKSQSQLRASPTPSSKPSTSAAATVVTALPLLPKKKQDEDTWREIELQRRADHFRKENLIGKCFDVWYSGLKWLEVSNLCSLLA